MTEKIFDYVLDGLSFSVRLYMDGSVVKGEITVTSGHADFNAIYYGNDMIDGSGFGGFTKKDSSLNMNGEGSVYDGAPVEWDGAKKLSSPGLGSAVTSEKTFLTEGSSMIFDLGSNLSIDDIDFLGIRATSTSTASGSIKAVAVPTEAPPPVADYFPTWAQDIGHVILVFDQTEGDTKPRPSGDDYYTVKIDSWPGAADDDLDNSIDAILAYLVANDQFIFDESDLLGVVIKGGVQTTQYFAYGAHDTNGTDPDSLPSGLGFTLPGDHGAVSPSNAIDQSYLYSEIFV